MKISINQLKNYINLQASTEELHSLMEDIGLEVKRVDISEDGGVVFNLELLANRGDHHSYQGIAQEIHGRTGWELSSINLKDVPSGSDTSLIEVQTDNCLSYTLTKFSRDSSLSLVNITEGQRQIVELSGHNIILPVVDATNFVGVEIGQPLHVFDADKVDGKVVVRETVAGETARLLFTDKDTVLPEGTIVIADNRKILAVAGVIGCEVSKPTEETQNVYLESATFDPIKIRKAAKALGIQSTASARFERGADPQLAVVGAKRAAVVLEQLGWRNVGNIKVAKFWEPQNLVLELDLLSLNSYFDTTYDQVFVSKTLERYGFRVVSKDNNVLSVTVPSHRMWDIKESKDLYEEVARSVGYNILPSALPERTEATMIDPIIQRRQFVEDVLVGQGFYEVFTDGFYSEKHRSNLNISEGHPLWDHVQTVNAGDRAFSLLKNNTLTQAVELVQTNANAKTQNVKAFEWTRTFYPNTNAPNGLCEERLVLWAIASGESRTSSWNDDGKKVDVFYMKGIVEEISNILGIRLEVRQAEQDKDILPIGACLHPTRRAAVYWGQKMIGVLGEVHPNVLNAWGIKNVRPCFIELSQDILGALPSERKYSPPTSLHPVIRDVCLLLPNGVAAGEIANYMRNESQWLSDIRITDLFNSEITGFKNAVTFSLEFSLTKAKKGQFTIEEINEATEQVVASTIQKYAEFSLERR